MERENAWKSYSDKDLDKLEKLSKNYIEFISENKTERECVERERSLRCMWCGGEDEKAYAGAGREGRFGQ